MYAAIDLAKHIVSKCIADSHPISNLQLQKILFYIQKEYLVTRDERAFSDAIEAWQFGPVVPNVYYYFCGFGSMPITIPFDQVQIEDQDAEIIDPIVEEKRVLYPWDLVSETHKKGGAWDQTYKDGNGNREEIKIELIKTAG